MDLQPRTKMRNKELKFTDLDSLEDFFVSKKPYSVDTSSISEVMKKSVITAGFEQLDHVANSNTSLRKLKLQRKAEREKTKGSQWFHLPATTVTPEVENDLKIIQMRSVLNKKHFYKKNDLKVLPKYFEVGKVVDSPIDYYSSRIPKKERKRTIVEELLADAEFQRNSKKKYKEIMAQRHRTHYKAHRNAKKLKRSKKK